MRRPTVSAAFLLAALAGGCTSPPAGQTPEPPELLGLRAEHRLAPIIDRVLAFRDGLLGEALDRGRVDREDRAAAATREIAELTLLLDAVPQGLAVDDAVDCDLARAMLDAAVADLALAHAKEPEIRHLAGGATALAFLADPAPPAPATIELFASGSEGLYPSAKVPPPDPIPAVPDLRAAAARNRQVARLLRARGAQCQVFDAARGKDARAAADQAAGSADAYAESFEKLAEQQANAADHFGTPVGRDEFVTRLRTQHGVDATPEELVAFGEDMLAQATSDLEALAAAEFPGRTWREAVDEVRRDHATPAEMPGEAYDAAIASRDFVIREGFVTIPEPARLAHIEMVDEEMSKSYPFAAYNYRRATADGESGRYLVSPGATWMDAAQQEERLRGNCRAWTHVVASHETWPGHHLQIWTADHLTSRMRRASSTPVFVEGWGLYCEGLLARHGFFTTPGEHLARLEMRAWRASRVILDVKLHCQAMKPVDAIDFLVEHAGLPKDGATAEVRRYCDSATQPFSYAWGCREIEGLRADEEARLGPAFDERAFHDKLLRCGPIPFPYVRRIFGYGGTPPAGR